MLNNTLSHYFKTLEGTGQSSGSPSHKVPSRGIHLTGVIAFVSAAAIALSGATVPVPSQASETGWNNNITASGSMHPVQLESLTDDTNNVKADIGVATYVGGNMYIGSPKSGARWSDDAINGSYAAEAEGQTVVKGDLLARPIKMGSDGKSFFTLGMVSFGTQYLPAAGTTILAVGGTAGAISTLGGGNDDHAQAWNAPVGIKVRPRTHPKNTTTKPILRVSNLLCGVTSLRHR